MKSTAWAVVPVLAVMIWSRESLRAAARFTGTAVGAAVLLALAAAPNALATPDAIRQNLIDYPLGTSTYKTVASSPLPGHLISQLGHAGHLTVDALLLLAVIAFACWLLLRPPRDMRDATVRLIVLYAVLFTLAPSTRYGYYAYPLALLGWLALTRGTARTADTERVPDAPPRPAQLPWVQARLPARPAVGRRDHPRYRLTPARQSPPQHQCSPIVHPGCCSPRARTAHHGSHPTVSVRPTTVSREPTRQRVAPVCPQSGFRRSTCHCGTVGHRILTPQSRTGDAGAYGCGVHTPIAVSVATPIGPACDLRGVFASGPVSVGPAGLVGLAGLRAAGGGLAGLAGLAGSRGWPGPAGLAGAGVRSRGASWLGRRAGPRSGCPAWRRGRSGRAGPPRRRCRRGPGGRRAPGAPRRSRGGPG